jgi:hypothetical protein
MWWGGFTFGPRYMISCLPFLALAVALLVREADLRHWPGLGWWFGLPVALSVLIVLPASLVGRDWPSETYQNPLPEFLWPKLLAGDLARNPGMALGLKGPLSYLPLLLALGLLYGALYHWPRGFPPGAGRDPAPQENGLALKLMEPEK